MEWMLLPTLLALIAYASTLTLSVLWMRYFVETPPRRRASA